MNYETILSPASIGSLSLKNRIIFAPTSLGLRGDAYLKQIEEIAKGGVAMLVIGDVPVLASKHGPSLFSQKGADHYKRIIECCHKHHTAVSAQLHQSDLCMKGMWKQVPRLLLGKQTKEELKAELNQNTGAYISSIPEAEVASITSAFGDAAKEAARLGFDLVQVHGDRMCGSFSSSLFNQRTDRYGGGPAGRSLFAKECVEAVKKAVPSLPIDFKLVVRTDSPHYGNAGITPEEVPYFVSVLEQAGVDSFHVTLANHGKLTDPIPGRNHPDFGTEGAFLPFADLVKSCTGLPVTGVGNLGTPDFVEEALKSGRIDFAAMSRQLIRDPEWVKKIEKGLIKNICRCSYCNQGCLGGMTAHKGVHCIYR